MTLTTTTKTQKINKKKNTLRLYQKKIGTNECFHQSDRKSKFKGQENSYTPVKKNQSPSQLPQNNLNQIKKVKTFILKANTPTKKKLRRA